jgi:hypothetical protein
VPKKTQQEIDREIQKDSYSRPTGAPAEQRRVTIVVALNNTDYQQWCKDNGKSASDRNYLMATPATARGLQNAHLEVTPRGMWRKDIHQLMVALIPMLDRPSVQKLAGMGWAGPVPTS